MATKKDETESDFCNMAYISGTIKLIKVREDGAFVLIDVGIDKRYIPMTTYGDEDKELTHALSNFSEGDLLRVKGYLRPWSLKKNDTWENKLEVRITEIKNKPPAREARSTPLGWDSDVPF